MKEYATKLSIFLYLCDWWWVINYNQKILKDYGR